MTAIEIVPFAETLLSEVAALLAAAGLSAGDVPADADGGWRRSRGREANLSPAWEARGAKQIGRLRARVWASSPL